MANKWWIPTLHKAAHEGNIEIVKFLVSEGADVNIKSPNGSTPLHQAAASENTADVAKRVEIAKFLIFQGAEVNVKNDKGETPLGVANTEEMRAILRAAGGR